MSKYYSYDYAIELCKLVFVNKQDKQNIRYLIHFSENDKKLWCANSNYLS